ncbi:MAG: NifB/NifX family molybdenum-iron cluster-binding protein [Bacillota bacterium]
MKVAISSSGTDRSALADPRFGRCGFFAIHETEDGSYRFLRNKAQDSGGGAGIAAAQQLIDEDVEVVLTGSLGPNAYRVIESAGMKAYRISNVSLEEAVGLFCEAKLESISEAGPAHLGIGQGPHGGSPK